MGVLKEIYMSTIAVVCIGVFIFILVKSNSGDWAKKGFDPGSGLVLSALVIWAVIYVAREAYRAIFT
jgi:hypothetical protein